MWLPSIPYPPERSDGYWAPITSTIDWCEENYVATSYAAEIVNTLTNLLFPYLAIKGMCNCYTQGHDRIFFIAFLGYLIIGLGSFCFHASLKYPMQLVDELGMIYTSSLMFFAAFQHRRPMLPSILLGLFAVSMALFITGYYHYLQDPTFHQNAFAILTTIVLLRSFWVMELSLRPRWRRSVMVSENSEKRKREDDRDKRILGQMWLLIVVGLILFLGGFAIWTIDNEFCSMLRKWRRNVGLPWGILLEGHGWWHLGTGAGTYYHFVWGIWLRHCLNGKQEEYELVWPSLWTSLPRVMRRVRGTTGSQHELKKQA